MPVFLLPLLSGLSTVLRIPAIATFFAALAAQIVTWFSTFVSRGLAINLTVITIVVGLGLAISTSLWVALQSLSYALPPEFSQGMGFIVPSNAIPCLSTIAAARVTRWVWEWQIYVIHGSIQ